MQIIWHGHFCFEIITTPTKNSQARLSFPGGNSGGYVKIVIDPFNEELGLRVPKLAADIILTTTHSHQDHSNIKAVASATGTTPPFLISGPGEYEIKNIFIKGIHSWYDTSQGKERGENTIYTIEVEDLKLCHLGGFGQKELSEEQLEKIAEVNILMIPIGGVYTIDSKIAAKVISQIEPKIIIPMHYDLPKLKIHPVKSREAGAKQFNRVKLDGLDKFLKTMGIKSTEPLPKLSIKKKDLLEEEVKIIVLKP